MRAIDADALKKDLTRFYDNEVTAKQLIDEQPTIETQRKKGKWINIREGNRADCDQCGQSGRAWMNFCFLCGADMREDGEANE